MSLLLAASACGQGNGLLGGGRCTLIGCNSQVTFEVTGAGLHGKAGTVRLKACFDDVCHTSRTTVKANGASFGKGSDKLSVGPVDDRLAGHLLLPDGDYDETTVHRFTLEVRIGDGEPVRLERDVQLTRSAPNGEDCGPICWQAKVEKAA